MSWIFFVFLSLLYQYDILVQSDNVEPRVYGGELARYKVHKYLVKLEILDDGSFFCSGSIINEKWIVTSGHCFLQPTDVIVSQETTANSKVIARVEAKNIHIHPKWSTEEVQFHSMTQYDIALIKTNERIDFDEFVQPIKLAKKNPKVGVAAIIAGYGKSEKNQPRPREGVVFISECVPRSPGELCSEDLVRAGSGDSGGPLVSKGRLVGVTAASCVDESIPKECLTVYTSIAFHRDWIKNIIKKY